MPFKPLVFLVILMQLLPGACVERVDLELNQPAGQLVVEALVTTDTSNIQSVKLSRAVPFSSVKNNSEIQSIGDAQVTVSDDQGNVYSFEETVTGTYLSNFEATVGTDYTLHIQTADGSCYSSTPQRIQPTVAIEEIVVRYFNSSQKVQPGFYVYVRPESRGEGDTFYRWKSHWIKQISVCFTNPIELDVLRIGSESSEYNEHLVALIPFGNNASVLVQFKQYSINDEVFHLYELIQKQASLEGSIFDPALGPAKGNIFNAEDPMEEVLGIFQVSDVLYGHQMIHRGQFGVRPERPSPNPEFVHPCPGPYPPANLCPPCPLGTICSPCFYGENMTTVRPENWSGE